MDGSRSEQVPRDALSGRTVWAGGQAHEGRPASNAVLLPDVRERAIRPTARRDATDGDEEARKRMKDFKPDSMVERLMLETKYVRILGNALIPLYTTRLESGTRLALRSTGGDRGIAREVFSGKIYEKYSKPGLGQTVVDAGAHIGCFTLRSAELVGREGSVLSFEPSAKNYSLLCRNVGMNGLENVKTFNYALSDREGEAELLLTPNTGANSHFRRRDEKILPGPPQKVRLRRIDDIVREVKPNSVDFLKLDTEGSELPILKGGVDTLNRFHPNIAGEAHPSFSDSGKSILAYLADFGYEGKVEIYGKVQAYGMTDEMFYAWKQ